MKRLLYSVFIINCSLFILFGCTKPLTLQVSNPSLLERNNTLAEISLADLGLTASDLQHKRLCNEQGKEIPCQLMYYGDTEPQSLVFMVDNIRGGMRREYHFRVRKPSPVPVVCTAQFVPERKDDFAWENDLAAYRMYGPALAPENPSNGVDLWLKCTAEPIVAKFYDDDLHNGKPYHVNYGQGLDCYKVAHTLGCGGIAPYIDGKLCIGDHFTSWEIIEQGGLRTCFRLTYPTHTLTITCDAGSPLNKAEVQVNVNASTIHQLAAGIWLHGKIDNVTFSQESGWAAYAEDAVSDGGEPQGRNYCAVYIPNAKEIKVEDNHLLVISDSIDNSITDSSTHQLTYWFGGGWSQWQFANDADWFSAVSQAANTALLPLRVRVLNGSD